MKVNIEGVGIFDINEECLPSLLNFLSQNQSVKITEDVSVRERVDGNYTGRELLNG